MESLFVALNHALAGTPLVALAAAVVWGMLSVVLSPCHLASIPLIVGFIDGQGRMTTGRAFVISSLFAFGMLITIALIGVGTAVAGRMLGDLGSWANWLVGAIFLLVGLHLLDVIPMPWSAPGQVGIKRRGMLAALLLGLIFGLALGPCTFAFMAPVLGVAFGGAAGNPGYSVLLLSAYGIGHCSVIVMAGTFTEVLQRYLDWNERSRGAIILRKVCGLLVIAGGIWLIWSAAF